MTLLAVALIGAGAILIASALDNTPIATTFQKIISGQSLSLTGTASNASSGNSAVTTS